MPQRPTHRRRPNILRMKVMFVVQGEGRGHLTQALTLERMLRENGHEVVRILVGKSRARQLPNFFLRKAKAPVETFQSLNFIPSANNCHIAHVRTAFYNLLRTPKYLYGIRKIYRSIQESGADIVVNFYEILCGMTFYLLRPNVPQVCIAHQYLFLHPDFRFPQAHSYSRRWLCRYTRLTCLAATKVLALSMRPYADCAVEKLSVVPPLLRQEVLDAPRHHGDYITGYMLNAGFATQVMAWHEAHPSVKLRFFWDKKGADTVTKIDDTLSFHLIDDEAFLHSLANCKAYATTAGFESVCEALYMGKPALMVPVHIEQECNAFDAECEGAGVAAEQFDLDKLLRFANTYSEDVDFRMWENCSSVRIIALLESAYEVGTHAVSGMSDGTVSHWLRL